MDETQNNDSPEKFLPVGETLLVMGGTPSKKKTKKKKLTVLFGDASNQIAPDPIKFDNFNFSKNKINTEQKVSSVVSNMRYHET
jgi:hypothetical protein